MVTNKQKDINDAILPIFRYIYKKEKKKELIQKKLFQEF